MLAQSFAIRGGVLPHTLAALLATADKIPTLEPTDHCHKILTRPLSAHNSYLQSAEFRDTSLRDCSDEVRTLVDRALRA